MQRYGLFSAPPNLFFNIGSARAETHDTHGGTELADLDTHVYLCIFTHSLCFLDWLAIIIVKKKFEMLKKSEGVRRDDDENTANIKKSNLCQQTVVE